MTDAPNPTVLIVLDGFGHREETEHNAIAAADSPEWDRLWREAPHTLISGSGIDVGLPGGQMGNSEVGHMNLGAGRVVFQELTRINRDAESGALAENTELVAAVDRAREDGRTLHVMGLVSPGGVHSHEDHIAALIRMAAARGAPRVLLHAFLDGRDTPPRSAGPSLERMDALFAELGCGRTASLVGRYYAMDRDNRWDRVERAYNMLTRGEAPFHAATATEGLAQAYGRDEGDEFVQPTALHDPSELPARIEDGDAVVFMNFRADRARQLTRAFVEDAFDGFERRTRPALGRYVMLTRYADDIDQGQPYLGCAYAPQTLANTLGEYVADRGLTQLRIAETEKYAHVTFFFSGGREAPFDGEVRELIPSPKVATYDLQPEMSAVELTDALVKAIESRAHDLIVCNYANGDMVGHTGVFDAAVQAVETLDACLARIHAALDAVSGQALITADHGNVERMSDPSTGQAHTAHTTEPVPLVYIGPRTIGLSDGGTLADVAPTLLALMDLPQPGEMTGRSLLTADAAATRAAS
jgi:2,3-bisphosphoglycerate-independent phosphoglycerate mutase